MNTNEYLAGTRKEIGGTGAIKTRPRAVCADGFNVSIQASSGHWCRPKENNGPYTHVEFGYPSEVDDLLTPYANDSLGGVYSQMPVEVVDAILEKHGALRCGLQ
jgi:hypothetical protein